MTAQRASELGLMQHVAANLADSPCASHRMQGDLA